MPGGIRIHCGRRGCGGLWGERRSCLYRLLDGRTRLDGRPSAGAQVRKGRLCGQTKSGASRGGGLWGEGLLVGEHVPDGLGQPAGDVDLGDLRAALAAEPALGVLVALAVGPWRRACMVASSIAQRRYFGPALVKGPRRSLSPD